MRVDLEELNEQTEELRRAAEKMLELYDSVRNIDAHLQGATLRELFHPILLKEKDKVLDAYYDLRKLTNSLSRIMDLYASCEMRIEENAEPGLWPTAPRASGLIRLPDLGPGILDLGISAAEDK